MAQIGENIERAVSMLKSNDLVAIPTETVYGLAGNALNEDAVLRIYEVKRRPRFDPLIAHTNSINKIEKFVKRIPENALKLAHQFWPGPLTLLLDKLEVVPDLLTSGLDRIAVRIPNHPLAIELLEQLDFPLAAPSANPFGYVSPIEAKHVEEQLGEQLHYILDGGRCQIGLESTIVGFEEGEVIIYRLGGEEIEEIEALVGRVRIETHNSSNPVAPGMLKSHYSPGKKLILGDIGQNLKNAGDKKIGIISFSQKYDVANENQFVLSPLGDLGEAARNIFKALRQMDTPEVEIILAEYVPDTGLGRAINDRLRRASI